MKRALLVLLLCAVPVTVQAQSLRASIAPVVHAYVEQTPPQDAADAVVTDKALAAAEWLYIGVQGIATGYGAIAAYQKGDDAFQVAMTGVAATSAGLAAAKLLPARWQRFAALIVTSGITAAVTGRQIAADYQAARAK